MAPVVVVVVVAPTIASEVGIRSFAAAVAFAVLYVPLLLFFLAKAIVRHVYVHVVLIFFCAVRVTAFVLRAVLSRVHADADNLDLVIAYEILYNIGFVGLVYSAYTLVIKRVALTPLNDPVSRLLRRRILFRILLTVAITLGITGVVQSTSGTTHATISTGDILRRTATYIFLVCTALVVLQTCILAHLEFSKGAHRHPTNQIGSTYSIYILLLIAFLLLVREVFFTTTSKNNFRQNDESYWYPFSVVTEFLAVLLFAIPGLVPVETQAS